MKKLTFLVLLVGAIYSAYWLVGANAVETKSVDGIAQARAEGWGVEYGTLETIGFPSRFDTTIDNVVISAPDARWTWQAPFLQVFALSYQPNKIIAAFPKTQTLRVDDQTLRISSDDLRVSAGVRPNSDLSLDTITAEAEAAKIASDLGWATAFQTALFAIRATPDVEQSYDAYAQITDLTVPPELRVQLNDAAVLPNIIDVITIDSRLDLDQTLDRHSNRPAVQSITLEHAEILWGTRSITAEGTVEIDAAGIPTGRIALMTKDWDAMIGLLVSADLIKSGVANTLGTMAGNLANSDGVLELPLTFSNGFMSLGPIPLGRAPRLR